VGLVSFLNLDFTGVRLLVLKSVTGKVDVVLVVEVVMLVVVGVVAEDEGEEELDDVLTVDLSVAVTVVCVLVVVDDIDDGFPVEMA